MLVLLQLIFFSLLSHADLLSYSACQRNFLWLEQHKVNKIVRSLWLNQHNATEIVQCLCQQRQ